MTAVAAADTAENRAELFGLLLDAELLVATREGPVEEENRVAQEGDKLELLFLEPSVLPAFTDLDHLLECQPEGSGYAAMSGGALFELAAENDISRIEVNPASATHGSIERWEIETLARGRLPLGEGESETVPAGTRLKVGTPSRQPSQEVLDAVREALGSEDRVASAWLFLFQTEPNPPEHAVAVEFDPEAKHDEIHEFMRKIVQRAGDQAEGVRDVLFVPFDGFLEELSSAGVGQLIFRR